MFKSQRKRQAMTRTSQLSEENHTDPHQYATRQRCRKSLIDSEDDDDVQITERYSRYARRNTPYGPWQSRTPRIDYRISSLRRRLIVKITDAKPEQNILSTTEKKSEDAWDISSERKPQSIETAGCKSDVSLDCIMRDEVVRKLSTCLSFYGNFVIIPALKETLDNIEKMDKDVKFSYWHEVMTFIDSYDLPYVSESRKKLVDELVAKITEYVESEGLSASNWQNIICTLPDDASSKFDHRLDNAIMEEVATLAKQDRLPFHLSEPINQLLKSAKKHAGKYIRKN
jgi:hypothetical protein